jgi:hypothetical protein
VIVLGWTTVCHEPFTLPLLPLLPLLVLWVMPTLSHHYDG